MIFVFVSVFHDKYQSCKYEKKKTAGKSAWKPLAFNEWFAVILWLHISCQEIYSVENSVKIFWEIPVGLLTRQSCSDRTRQYVKPTKLEHPQGKRSVPKQWICTVDFSVNALGKCSFLKQICWENTFLLTLYWMSHFA